MGKTERETHHIIAAWSGDPEDETPLCGANKDDVRYRTIYPERLAYDDLCAECVRRSGLCKHLVPPEIICIDCQRGQYEEEEDWIF